MSARDYITSFTAIFVTLSLMTAGVNFLVDPYLVFGNKRYSGFNDVKVDINPVVRTSKAYHPTFSNWDTLLVGNSRVEMGLDPRHECFRKTTSGAYNLGIPGAGIPQQLEYALNVIYEQDVKHVFLGVDFVDFLVREGTERPKPDSEPPTTSNLRFAFNGSPNARYRWNAAKDRYQALFSLEATWSSARTILLQSETRPTRDEHGFNPALDFNNAVRTEGPSALFEQKLATLDSHYRDAWSLTYSDGSLSRDFEWISLFVDIASQRGTGVIVFTNPFHEEFWSLLRRHGLYELHSAWLTELTSTLEDSDGSPALWDFTGDSRFIHESVPKPGEKAGPLNWFWEPAHYRRELGDLMIDAMLSDRCNSAAVFGRRIL